MKLLNFFKKTPKINITDIQIDEEGRAILNTPDKIIRWIDYRIEEQVKENKSNPEVTNEISIDLSNCVLCTKTQKETPVLTNLCDLAGKSKYIIKNKKTSDNKKYHQEVLLPIICRNSIIHNAFFHSTIFHKSIHFQNTRIEGQSMFSGCIFYNDIKIHSSTLNGADFSFCQFEGVFEITESAVTFVTQLNFYKSIFKKAVYFSHSEFKSSLPETHPHYPKCIVRMSFTTFNETLFMRKINFNNYPLDFTHSIFNGKIDIGDVSLFTLTFDSSHINGSLFINYSDIQCLSLNSVVIKDTFDILVSQFHTLQGHSIEINKETVFRIYHCNIQLLRLKSLVNKGIFILSDNGDKIKRLELEQAINIGRIELTNTFIKELSDRKTACLLKDSAFKANNIIDALRYKEIELSLYTKEKDVRIYTRILLFFNKISNKHGLSWVRGVCFTVTVAFLFFILINYIGMDNPIFVIDFKSQFSGAAFGNAWKAYLDVLNVLNFRDKLNNMELNAWGETFFFLSKIFISYGIFQTVSAFRKYGK